MGKDVIVALDFPTGKEALDFLDLFQKEERKPYVKVGMELFYSEGPERLYGRLKSVAILSSWI